MSRTKESGKRFHAAGICDCCEAPPEPEDENQSCGKLMRGIYDALTTCARPEGHTGKHNPVWDARDWERPE